MNYIIGIFLSLVFSQSVLAERFYSSVHSIDYGKADQDHLIRFDNGRVSFLNPEKNKLLTMIELNSRNQTILKIKTNDRNQISSIVITDDKYHNEVDNPLSSTPYTPAVVKNTNEALKIHNKMRKDYTRNGECFNRAHIWAYEEYNRSKLNLMKIFMFFTTRYIRKYKYHWWFHVTPMVYVGNLNSPRTLDRRYTSGPRQTKTWSNTFIKSKRTCKIVKKFDDYYLNQQKEDCYHIYSSMYYVIPRDLEKRDLTGVEKSEFIEKEIKRGYRNGFNKTRIP